MDEQAQSAMNDTQLDALLASTTRSLRVEFEGAQEAGLAAILAETGDTVPPLQSSTAAVSAGELTDAAIWRELLATGSEGSFGSAASGPAKDSVGSVVLTPTRVLVHAAVQVLEVLETALAQTADAPTTTALCSGSAVDPASGDQVEQGMDLVKRAQLGDGAAFSQLYDEYLDPVYRYIYYRVGGRAVAEDLTSETFLVALRRIDTFTWQGRDFGSWLVTIARNLVAGHFKSSRFRLEVTTGEMLEANEVASSAEDCLLESLSNAALLEAVSRLSPPQQRCVTLRFLQGLSIAETASIMGINEGAIKTLQYRAVRTLARLLPEDVR